jgi:hypothetical protein
LLTTAPQQGYFDLQGIAAIGYAVFEVPILTGDARLPEHAVSIID